MRTGSQVAWARWIVVLGAILAIVTASCESNGSTGGDGDGDTTVVTVTASPNIVEDDGRFFTISEVGFGRDGYVALTNFTEVSARLSDLFICEPPECVALPEQEVASGETAVVAMGDGKGQDGVVLNDAGLNLQPASGEVGLYASKTTDDSGDIRAYVQWGSAEHEGTPAALEAGLWLEGSFVESADDATRIYRSESGEWESE